MTDTTPSLCEFERSVLRVVAGEKVPGMSWGAAMSVALEFLSGSNLIHHEAGVYRITEAGLAELAKGAGK